MKESPYFRKRRHVSGGSPYFRQAPSSAFGAVQSMGSLLSCLGRYAELYCHPTEIDSDDDKNKVSDLVHLDLTRNAIRHFEDCSVFQKVWESSSWKATGEDGAERRLETSVRHLCQHRCYYRAYAPARAWLAVREALQSETSLPIEQLLQGLSCILLPSSCCKDTQVAKVAFVDPLHLIVWSEKDVIHSILSASSRTRALSRRSIPKCCLFDAEPTTKRKRTSSSRATPKTISITDSPLGLLEELFVDDPFKLLLSTIFLNRTTRIQVDPILCEFLEQWSTPESVLGAELNHLVTILRPLGMCHRRAAGIQQFSRDFLEMARHTNPRHFSRRDLQKTFYCGRYAIDAYVLFIQRNGSVEPLDHALRAYAGYQRGLH